ncbi:VWA domain-containing protein [Nakamurella sp. YIM 132087]|uniref:VWA domain-containing protein n=1 Tax=Nakamurella alba TaxID=2665158 RepID=A0A7K1FS86_9ACTN|nr:VWA domain-containing protein [Nakamurella alba]MTD17005.1 VWA domain-containing protein [Nakamurella alba]
MTDTAVTTDRLAPLAGFPRALAAAGLAVGPDRTDSFLRATHLVDAGRPDGVYWAGRATLTAHPDDIPLYDAVFEAWFGGDPVAAARTGPPGTVRRTTMTMATTTGAGTEDSTADTPPVRAAAADAEVLRHKDLARLTAAEKAEMAAMLALLRPGLPDRRSSRRRPHRHGPVDPHRTVRAVLRAGGEPAALLRHRRRTRPRRIVLLVDVSGSMAPYADSLLRFAHLLVRRRPRAVEVFTIGTRLSRITRALSGADADQALAAAAEVIPDYSGGTRLGEVLRAFTDRWGRRGTARGAVLVIFSDGWERGGPELLAEQVDRLHRLARTTVWVNPHKGKDGYAPVQTGIVAVLPYLDHFLAGHTLATLEELLEVIRDA